MIWAMEGFGVLYEATSKRNYLDLDLAVADYASFYQSVWQPHFLITAYGFGGYASQNSDAEWLDMRQSQYGEAMVRLAKLAGRQDLLERGVAAIRAQFALSITQRSLETKSLRFLGIHVAFPRRTSITKACCNFPYERALIGEKEEGSWARPPSWTFWVEFTWISVED